MNAATTILTHMAITGGSPYRHHRQAYAYPAAKPKGPGWIERFMEWLATLSIKTTRKEVVC